MYYDHFNLRKKMMFQEEKKLTNKQKHRAKLNLKN